MPRGRIPRCARSCFHLWFRFSFWTRPDRPDAYARSTPNGGLGPDWGPCPGLVSGRLVLPADPEAEDPSRVVDNQGADVSLGQTALTQAGYDVGEQMVVSEAAVGVKPMLGGDVV